MSILQFVCLPRIDRHAKGIRLGTHCLGIPLMDKQCVCLRWACCYCPEGVSTEPVSQAEEEDYTPCSRLLRSSRQGCQVTI